MGVAAVVAVPLHAEPAGNPVAAAVFTEVAITALVPGATNLVLATANFATVRVPFVPIGAPIARRPIITAITGADTGATLALSVAIAVARATQDLITLRKLREAIGAPVTCVSVETPIA